MTSSAVANQAHKKNAPRCRGALSFGLAIRRSRKLSLLAAAGQVLRGYRGLGRAGAAAGPVDYTVVLAGRDQGKLVRARGQFGNTVVAGYGVDRDGNVLAAAGIHPRNLANFASRARVEHVGR